MNHCRNMAPGSPGMPIWIQWMFIHLQERSSGLRSLGAIKMINRIVHNTRFEESDINIEVCKELFTKIIPNCSDLVSTEIDDIIFDPTWEPISNAKELILSGVEWFEDYQNTLCGVRWTKYVIILNQQAKLIFRWISFSISMYQICLKKMDSEESKLLEM